MADIFISYKREDQDAVQRIVEGLRGAELSVWWDRDIAPDDQWEATIERELEAAKVVIVTWSEVAVASENVKAEARRARKQGKLIQVFAGPCDPPLFFGERQGVDLIGWTGVPSDKRFQTLVTAARAILTGKRPPVGVGYLPRKRAPWTTLMVAFVVLSAALAFVSNLGGARSAVCSLSALSAACVQFGNPALSVEILSPESGSMVSPRHEIAGTVSDPNAEVWVLLSPTEANKCWVQLRAVVRGRRWIVNAYFGGPSDAGAHYTIRAIANPENPMHPGETEDCWPSASGESAAVLNLVRSP